MDGRHLPYGRHRTRRTGRLVRRTPAHSLDQGCELLALVCVAGRRRSTLVVVGRPGRALTLWRRPDLGRPRRLRSGLATRRTGDPVSGGLAQRLAGTPLRPERSAARSSTVGTEVRRSVRVGPGQRLTVRLLYSAAVWRSVPTKVKLPMGRTLWLRRPA